MFPTIVLLTAGLPAFNPAPVFRHPVVTGSLFKMDLAKAIMTVKCEGRERSFKVARDAKFTFNREEGYSYDDLTEIFYYHKPIVTLTLMKGVATSVDVTLTLRSKEKLWLPGQGSMQRMMREDKEHLRAAEAQMLQGR